jgi:Ca-activated chloride channel family protein
MRFILSAVISIGLLLMAFRSVQDFTVKGFVMDENGLPLANIVIKEKQKNNSTLTGADGSFSLHIVGSHTTLVFTGVGFEKQELSVSGQSGLLNINMKAVVASLNEADESEPVYRKEVTGSVTIVPAQALDSKASGVDVRQHPYISKKDKSRKQLNANGRYPVNPTNQDFNTEDYDPIVENSFLSVTENPLSTFSIDVDGSSYSNVRRFLQMGQMPPPGSVRIEEMINYFHYNYPQPECETPFSINTETGDCAWNPGHKLVMIGLQGRRVPVENLPACNIVFLIDVSGSMMEPQKLPLVKQSLKMLVDQLREEDHVSLVVYAGNAGLVMPSTSGAEKIRIKNAIDRLEAGGSTAGGAGIRLAYRVAEQNFVKKGNNRVILCTDGDFNVGPSSDADLVTIIENERKTGIFLTVLGYGMGNYKDNKMEKLADKGNGNHAYIDNAKEARKVLVNEFGGTLFTIAKDVKLQVEFNPAKIQSYRLVGYENRMLNKEDFNDDIKDAGELGSGHTVTAIYEIIPTGAENDFPASVDSLKYQRKLNPVQHNSANEMMTIKFRYKNPDGDKSKLIQQVVMDHERSLVETSVNFRFVSAVAQFGMLLRNSAFKQQSSYENVYLLAKNALGTDQEGYRAEFLQLVRGAGRLAKKETTHVGEDDLSGIK